MNVPLIKAIIILPGTALVYVPALILWLTRGTTYAPHFPPDTALHWLAGFLFAVAGLTLMIWTIRLFALKGGGGTPAPWQPVENFIVSGPYLYARNPMLIGVNLFLIAEALLLKSWPIFIWMIVFVASGLFLILRANIGQGMGKVYVRELPQEFVNVAEPPSRYSAAPARVSTPPVFPLL